MLQVLLVDDEPFILQGLQVLIDWKREGFEIAGVASDGQEAYEFLQKNKVDLIIADIKMPRMSGIELLETIRREKISDAYYVILSGYSDFSFAQQAMRCCCTDYILKPVDQQELKAVLAHVAELSETTRRDAQKQKKLEYAYLARNILALLFGKYDEINLEYVKNHMRLSEGVRYIDIEFHDLSHLEDGDEGELRGAQRKLYQSCLEYLKEDGSHCIFDVSQDEKQYDVGFIYCDYMSESCGCSEKEYLERMRDVLAAGSNYPVRMLVGKKVHDIGAVAKSYTTACILNSLQAFREKRDIYLYEEEIQVNNGGIVLCKNGLDGLIASIEQNDNTRIRQSVEQLYEEMQQMGVSGDTVNLNINYLLFQLIHLAAEQDDGVNQEEILQFISESSFEEGIMRGSKAHLCQFALDYAEYLAQLRKNVSRGVLAEVEREVRERYAENLTLRELSQKYYVNSAYLGQLFRKKYGQTFKDYLNSYRIEQAAALLLRTDDKIYDIAQKVGYHDLDYFINRFIAAKGCTPAKFRKQLGR